MVSYALHLLITPSSPRVVMLATLLRVFAGKVQTLRSPVELLVKCFIRFATDLDPLLD